MTVVSEPRPRKLRRKVVRIAVMGVTGAGKSTFIRTVSGDNSIIIGETLASGTLNVASYEFTLDNIKYVLVDTPGFDDDKQSDGEILKRISDFLSAEHETGNLLSGIIYLHPINRPRVQGSTMVQIRVFKEFCGSDSYHNVVLGTTFWEAVDKSEAGPREHELFSNPGFLGDIKDLGARPERVYKDRQSCIQLVKSFAGNEPVALKIQRDMAAGAGGFDTSSAAAAALAPEIQKLRLDHDRQLEEERRKAKEEEERRAQQEAQEEARRRQAEKEREEERQRERERIEREEREYQSWLWRQRQKEKEEEEQRAEERRREAAKQAELQRQREAEAKKRAEELERERQAEKRRQQEREEEQRKQEERVREERRQALIRWTRKTMFMHSGGWYRTYRKCPGPIGHDCGRDCSGDSVFYECDRCEMPCCRWCYWEESYPIYHRIGCFYKEL